MSLGDAFRKLGHIEAVRRYAEDAPMIVGNYASEAFAEVGDALEHYLNSRIYGALEQMAEEEALLREEMVRAIRKAVQKGVEEAVKEAVRVGVKEAVREILGELMKQRESEETEEVKRVVEEKEKAKQETRSKSSGRKTKRG